MLFDLLQLSNSQIYLLETFLDTSFVNAFYIYRIEELFVTIFTKYTQKCLHFWDSTILFICEELDFSHLSCFLKMSEI